MRLASVAGRFEDAITPKLDTVLRVGWVVVIGCFLILAIGSLIGVLNKDEAAFAYVAKGMLNGELPYVDRWDQKGPLTYVLSLVGVLIGDLWGIRVLAGVFLIASTFAAYRLIRDGFGQLAAFFATVILLVYYARLNPGGMTEHYALLFQFLALHVFVRIEHQGDASRWEDSRSGRDFHLPFLVGVLGAAAFLLRPDLVGVWLAIGIYWLIHERRIPARLWWAVLGGTSVLAVVAGTLLLVGGLAAFWDATYAYNFRAYGDGPGFVDRLWTLRQGRSALLSIVVIFMSAWIVALFVVVVRPKLPGGHHPLVRLAVILLPLELLLVSLPGYGYAHYYVALLPAILLLLGFAVWFVVTRRYVAATFLSIVLLLGSAHHYRAYDVVSKTISRLTTDVGGRDIRYQFAARIRRTTSTGDTVLVWGFQPLVHLVSERDSPTRYFYQFPLMMPGYTSRARVDGFVQDVRSKTPAAILDQRDRRLPPLDHAARNQWQGAPRYLDDVALFDALFDFIETNYEAVEERSGWVLYTLKTPATIK